MTTLNNVKQIILKKKEINDIDTTSITLPVPSKDPQTGEITYNPPLNSLKSDTILTETSLPISYTLTNEIIDPSDPNFENKLLTLSAASELKPETKSDALKIFENLEHQKQYQFGDSEPENFGPNENKDALSVGIFKDTKTTPFEFSKTETFNNNFMTEKALEDTYINDSLKFAKTLTNVDENVKIDDTTIDPLIEHKLLTADALDDTYIKDSVKFAPTLTTNPENTNYIIHKTLTALNIAYNIRYRLRASSIAYVKNIVINDITSSYRGYQFYTSQYDHYVKHNTDEIIDQVPSWTTPSNNTPYSTNISTQCKYCLYTDRIKLCYYTRNNQDIIGYGVAKKSTESGTMSLFCYNFNSNKYFAPQFNSSGYLQVSSANNILFNTASYTEPIYAPSDTYSSSYRYKFTIYKDVDYDNDVDEFNLNYLPGNKKIRGIKIECTHERSTKYITLFDVKLVFKDSTLLHIYEKIGWIDNYRLTDEDPGYEENNYVITKYEPRDESHVLTNATFNYDLFGSSTSVHKTGYLNGNYTKYYTFSGETLPHECTTNYLDDTIVVDTFMAIDDDINHKLMTSNALEDTYITDTLKFAPTLTTIQANRNLEPTIDPEIEHKLVTTNALDSSYINETLKFSSKLSALIDVQTTNKKDTQLEVISRKEIKSNCNYSLLNNENDGNNENNETIVSDIITTNPEEIYILINDFRKFYTSSIDYSDLIDKNKYKCIFKFNRITNHWQLKYRTDTFSFELIWTDKFELNTDLPDATMFKSGNMYYLYSRSKFYVICNNILPTAPTITISKKQSDYYGYYDPEWATKLFTIDLNNLIFNNHTVRNSSDRTGISINSNNDIISFSKEETLAYSPDADYSNITNETVGESVDLDYLTYQIKYTKYTKYTIGPQLTNKLLTADTLKDAYVINFENNDEWIDANRDKLVTVNALDDAVDEIQEKLIEKIDEKIDEKTQNVNSTLLFAPTLTTNPENTDLEDKTIDPEISNKFMKTDALDEAYVSSTLKFDTVLKDSTPEDPSQKLIQITKSDITLNAAFKENDVLLNRYDCNYVASALSSPVNIQFIKTNHNTTLDNNYYYLEFIREFTNPSTGVTTYNMFERISFNKANNKIMVKNSSISANIVEYNWVNNSLFSYALTETEIENGWSMSYVSTYNTVIWKVLSYTENQMQVAEISKSLQQNNSSEEYVVYNIKCYFESNSELNKIVETIGYITDTTTFSNNYLQITNTYLIKTTKLLSQLTNEELAAYTNQQAYNTTSSESTEYPEGSEIQKQYYSDVWDLSDVVHNENRTLVDAPEEFKIKYKLITTDALKDAYVTNMELDNQQWISQNKNKLVTVEAVKDFDTVEDKLLFANTLTVNPENTDLEDTSIDPTISNKLIKTDALDEAYISNKLIFDDELRVKKGENISKTFEYISTIDSDKCSISSDGNNTNRQILYAELDDKIHPGNKIVLNCKIDKVSNNAFINSMTFKYIDLNNTTILDGLVGSNYSCILNGSTMSGTSVDGGTQSEVMNGFSGKYFAIVRRPTTNNPTFKCTIGYSDSNISEIKLTGSVSSYKYTYVSDDFHELATLYISKGSTVSSLILRNITLFNLSMGELNTSTFNCIINVQDADFVKQSVTEQEKTSDDFYETNSSEVVIDDKKYTKTEYIYVRYLTTTTDLDYKLLTSDSIKDSYVNKSLVFSNELTTKEEIISTNPVNPDIEHKLLTTESLKDAYVNNLKMDNQECFDENKYKLLTVESAKDLESKPETEHLKIINTNGINKYQFGDSELVEFDSSETSTKPLSVNNFAETKTIPFEFSKDEEFNNNLITEKAFEDTYVNDTLKFDKTLGIETENISGISDDKKAIYQNSIYKPLQVKSGSTTLKDKIINNNGNVITCNADYTTRINNSGYAFLFGDLFNTGYKLQIRNNILEFIIGYSSLFTYNITTYTNTSSLSTLMSEKNDIQTYETKTGYYRFIVHKSNIGINQIEIFSISDNVKVDDLKIINDNDITVKYIYSHLFKLSTSTNTDMGTYYMTREFISGGYISMNDIVENNIDIGSSPHDDTVDPDENIITSTGQECTIKNTSSSFVNKYTTVDINSIYLNDISHKLITTDALENAYISDKLIFSDVLQTENLNLNNTNLKYNQFNNYNLDIAFASTTGSTSSGVNYLNQYSNDVDGTAYEFRGVKISANNDILTFIKYSISNEDTILRT